MAGDDRIEALEARIPLLVPQVELRGVVKLRVHRGGGFTVTLDDGTVLERNWSPATTSAEVPAECRAMAAALRRTAARKLAAAALWERAADGLAPPTLPLEESATTAQEASA